jgi:hypothetical protein
VPAKVAPRGPLPQKARSYRPPLPTLNPGPVLPISPLAPVGITELESIFFQIFRTRSLDVPLKGEHGN